MVRALHDPRLVGVQPESQGTEPLDEAGQQMPRLTFG
jgi:hypothetical protein